MPMTAFYGPLRVGAPTTGQEPIMELGGNVLLTHSVTINSNGTSVVSGVLAFPANSVVCAMTADTHTAFDSATAATLSIGTTAGGTEYASGVNVKLSGRVYIPATGAQSAALSSVSGNVFVTVTPTGATTAGAVRVSIMYYMTE